MAKTNDLIKVEGFDQLNAKLKQLDDKVKRKEVLKIFRKLAKPTVDAYASQLPKKSGTLAKSVKVETVPAGKAGGNPAIAIRPGKKGKHDGYYKFMVIKKGAAPGSRKRGSRAGINTVTEEARDKAAKQTIPQATQKAEQQTAKLIQKQIDKLS